MDAHDPKEESFTRWPERYVWWTDGMENVSKASHELESLRLLAGVNAISMKYITARAKSCLWHSTLL